MPYDIPATQRTPALIVYLLDVSGSMGELMNGVPKVDRVNSSLEKVLVRMIRRSTKGELISPRYRLGMIAYSTEPTDLLPGIEPIDQIAQRGTPQLEPSKRTDTARAFIMAGEMIARELPHLRGCPAPMICHLTDGEYTGDDPEPIAREIMQMSNDDGHVLIENIYIGDGLTRRPIEDVESWTGIVSDSELSNRHASKLLRMSSRLPASYAESIQEDGYSLVAGSAMLFPADNQDLIELAFAMSGATPTR